MIDEIVPQLPTKEEKIKNAYDSCVVLKKFISIDPMEFAHHLEKAKSDLSRVKQDFEKQYWDWTIIKSYYATMHGLNALLLKEKGFYAKDHFCVLLALKHFDLIPADLYLKLREIHAKFSDFTGFDVSYALRKIGQYDVVQWKKLTQEDAQSVYSLAREIISYVEKRCFS